MTPITANVRTLFKWESPDVIRLTEEIFDQCILGKLFPPEAPLNHNWISPGGWYRGQWIWNTMFVVDLLSLVPGTEAVIQGVFQNYWDFQTEWNRAMPDYAHDMIPCAIRPGKGVRDHMFSQIPILAWGLERVYRRNGDKTLLAQCLAPLEKFHDWYWRERDVTRIDLVAVGAYADGTMDGHWDAVQQARFETFDFE